MVRSKKHCQYTPEEMKSDIDAVQNEGFSISKAALLDNAPRKILSDRINGTHEKVALTILTPEEEGYLIIYNTWLTTVPLGVKQIYGFAWSIVKQSARKNQFLESGTSEHW